MKANQAAEEAQSSQNMSLDELIAQRVAAATADPQPEPEETEEESEQEPPADEPETVEDDEEQVANEEDAAPEIDLLSLEPGDIQKLVQKHKSRLLQRIGELTAKNKALEEKANRPVDAKPVREIPAETNPFRDLKTEDEIKAKFAELEQIAEDTDRILEDHEDYAAEDIIEVGGKEFTKKEIRLANRNARDAMVKYLPAQAREIALRSQREAMTKQYDAAIPLEIPDLADEKSDLYQQFQAMKDDPLVEQVRLRVPDLAPQINYILAHAVRSISQKTLKPKLPATAIKPQAKVPGSPVGAGAARRGEFKQKDEAYQKFEQTGDPDAWVAARIARMKS